jgi:hypothetical protein
MESNPMTFRPDFSLCTALACAGLFACSSSDDGDSGSTGDNGSGAFSGPEAGDAAYECETFLTTYCGRVNECSLNVNEQECLTDARTSINCGDAADVSASYDRCLDELESSTCDGLFGDAIELPASCQGVILFLQ